MANPYPVGGNGGIMSDLMTSDVEGSRRIKVSSQDAALDDAFNNRRYVHVVGFTIPAGQKAAVNFSSESNYAIISARFTDPSLLIELHQLAAVGSLNGDVTVRSKNLDSNQKSLVKSLAYDNVSLLGVPVWAGVGVIAPNFIAGIASTPSIGVINNQGTSVSGSLIIEVGELAGRPDPQAVFYDGETVTYIGDQVTYG